MRYQAGTLLFHRDAAPEVLQRLRVLTFPLLAPDTTFEDEQVREAAMWALGKEHLRLDQLRIEGTGRLLFFKHEERPVLIYPHKLVVGKSSPDELNKPHLKLNVAFTLPPGSYATLCIKRLFYFAEQENRLEAPAKVERPQKPAKSRDKSPRNRRRPRRV
jgi:tRNA pseudouridine13 synthase